MRRGTAAWLVCACVPASVVVSAGGPTVLRAQVAYHADSHHGPLDRGQRHSELSLSTASQGAAERRRALHLGAEWSGMRIVPHFDLPTLDTERSNFLRYLLVPAERAPRAAKRSPAFIADALLFF